MSSAFLYISTVAIWGSTWIAIRYQLGEVAPMVSIAHRFALAALMLLALTLPARRLARLSLRDHGFVLLQGLSLFSVNYLFIYAAAAQLTSGLIAVVFSTMVILNILGGALFLGLPVRPAVAFGAACGMAGIAAVFLPELRGADLAGGGLRALLLCAAGTVCASLGNMIAARNHRRQLPVLTCNTWGMFYGSLTLYGAALLSGESITVAFDAPYLLSLLYLSLFGSVIAFWAYITLIGQIGPDRASYATLLFPVVALLLSTLFEGYRWTPMAAGGLLLVLGGNWIAMRRNRP
jgi:drug/metabolite transporter (DMT)-like permease